MDFQFLTLLMLIAVRLVASMEDTCEKLNCGGQGWECRNLRVCEESGTCRVAVPTCIYKDTSRYRIPNICPRGGHPVVDTSGKEVTCGGAKDCPLGFSCRGGVCCPGAMAGVALPICRSLVKPNYNLPLFSTLEVCANECMGDGDCEEDQVCCFRECGSKCVRIDPKARANTDPITRTVSSISTSVSPSSSPSIFSPTLPSSPIDLGNASAAEGGGGGGGRDVENKDNQERPPRPDDYVISTFGQGGPSKQGVVDNIETLDYASDAQEGKPQVVVPPSSSVDTQEGKPQVAVPPPSSVDTQEGKPQVAVPPPSSVAPVKRVNPPLVSAPVPRPPTDNSRKGPVQAKSVRVTAPDASTAQDNSRRNPAEDYPQKPGRCPARPSLVICGQRGCGQDSVCPGPTKCCPTRCGLVCVSPQTSGAYTGRLGGLQGSLFRDIGVGRSPSSRGSVLSRDENAANPTSPGVFGRTLRNYGVDFASQGPRSETAPQNQDFLRLQSLGKTDEEEGFYNPREGPLFQYGFRSPVSNTAVSPSSRTASLGNKYTGEGPSASRTSAGAGDVEGRAGSVQRESDTGGLNSEKTRGEGAAESIQGVSGANTPARKANGAGTQEQDGGRSRQSSADDPITSAVNTAFRLNPPPQPPNNARRGVSNRRPSGGLLGGYALSFPDSPAASFPGYASGPGVRGLDGGVSSIGFAPRSRIAARSPFGEFPGYGPGGFFDSAAGVRGGLGGYDTVDAGAFGNINRADYEKLGLDTVSNSFNKTRESESRSSGVVSDATT